MSIETKLDVETLLESVLAGHHLDPETAERVRRESEQITEEIRQRYGDVDVAQLIRDVRNDP